MCSAYVAVGAGQAISQPALGHYARATTGSLPSTHDLALMHAVYSTFDGSSLFRKDFALAQCLAEVGAVSSGLQTYGGPSCTC